jgi:hypothetical protein
MSQTNQCCCCEDTENNKGSENEYQVRLYSPYPNLRMVMISSNALLCDRLTCVNPVRMIHIANEAVSVFKLNPAQVVWIEHVSSGFGSLFCADFYLVYFDWKSGQATSSYRVPIAEGWYLSWLKAEHFSEQLKLTI